MSEPISTSIAAAKTAWYAGMFALLNYLSIPAEPFAILGILMVIDFATGIAKQYRLDPKKITSHEATLGALKKAMAIIVLGVIALIMKAMGIDPAIYVNGFLSILVMAEGYSIIQNSYAVRTGVVLPEFDVISIALKAFLKFLRDKLEIAITPKKKE